MKKINLSKVFREKRSLFSFTAAMLAIIVIVWIAPTLSSFYWHFTHGEIGSFSLQIQTMIILSIIAYPTCSFLVCFIVSLFRPLKSQNEGGLFFGIFEVIRVGCICFVAACLFLGLPALITGNFKVNSDYLGHFVEGMNIFLFMFTATGIGMLIYSLSKEFNPK